MGVPGFFLWLIKKYKEKAFVFSKNSILEKDISDDINNIQYLLLDANCLFHPKCFETADKYKDLSADELEIKMFENITNYMHELIKYVNPKKGVFIAVDGTAPMAKIKQQRLRRFKSIADKELQNSIKKKYGKPIYESWNNSAITPGTKFMEKLHIYILKWIKTIEIDVIYSSYKTPGEGEHKLVEFIKNENPLFKHVIYGLDADLIFLSFICKKNVYLLRESVEINKQSNDGMVYININIMKELIYDTFITAINKKFDTIIELDNIINDFIFICYLIGNDFLPHIASLNIKNYGLEYLIKTYSEAFITLNTGKHIIYIISDTNINISFFKKMIELLSIQEDTILKSIRMPYFTNNKSDPYERELFKIENLQFNIIDDIKLGKGTYEEYRKRYYKHHWGVKDDELEEFVKKIVKHYLYGIKWITTYYFKACPSWSWYYPFDHPPFITDIYNNINYTNLNAIKFNDYNIIDSVMQLLLVLPPQSKFLLPDIFQKELSKLSPITYLYPKSFEQDFINKSKHWMGIPILPPMDIKLVKKFYNKHKAKLNESEKLLNERENIYIFTK